MADQETLTSAAPPATDEATGTESSHGEQPSAGAADGAAAPVAGGQATVDLKTLTKDQLADLWENPEVRAEIGRRAQQQKDIEIRNERRRWDASQQAMQEAERARQERERILNEDEFNLGKEAKDKAAEAKLRERFYAEFERDLGPQWENWGRQQAIDFTYGEIGQVLQKVEWFGAMNEQERLAWLRQNGPNPSTAILNILEHTTARERKRLEADMAKLREASEQETRAAERAGEASPDLGGGAPAGGRLSEREYQANRHNQAWVNANMDRLKEAASRGFA